MEKQTKILLGIGAVIAAYLILKPKKALGDLANSGQKDPLAQDIVTPPDVVTPPPPPVDNGKKTAVEPATKPCEVTYHNCTPNPRKEIIQIPYDDEKCYTPMRFGGYQPERPPCAQPMPDDRFGKNIIDARLNEYLYA
jgi:hypothetical protein